MNWSIELPATAPADVLDAIDGLELRGEESNLSGIVAQFNAAKVGAKAMIEEMEIPDGMLVGAEFTGDAGVGVLDAITTRVRLVEVPPEPEAPASEVEKVEEEPVPA